MGLGSESPNPLDGRGALGSDGGAEHVIDVLVVGAGVAGLTAARGAARAGLSVRVVDKARGAGGRMATRRLGDARLDHGAQYVTARDLRFRAQVEAWERDGLARRWSDGFALEVGGSRHDGEARWIGTEGMARLARSLGNGLDVRVDARVAEVRGATVRDAAGADGADARYEARGATNGWNVTMEDGSAHAARAVVLTPPVPQTLALLDAGGVTLDGSVRADLEAVSYLPCVALLVRLDGPSAVPAPGGLWGRGEPIAWIADNRAKGVSLATGPGTELTIQAGPRWSAQHIDEQDDAIADALLLAARRWLGEAHVVERHVHRWRYSIAMTTHRDRALVVESPALAVFAGDGFGGARVEGAYLSGLAAAAALIERLR